MLIRSLLKYLWAGPASAVGLAVAAISVFAQARVSVHSGVLEVSFRTQDRRSLPFTAITLGHVVIAASLDEQVRLRAHERAHVAQYEVWGPFFLVAYPIESMFQLLLGRRPYLDNRFELQARRRAVRHAPRELQ